MQPRWEHSSTNTAGCQVWAIMYRTDYVTAWEGKQYILLPQSRGKRKTISQSLEPSLAPRFMLRVLAVVPSKTYASFALHTDCLLFLPNDHKCYVLILALVCGSLSGGCGLDSHHQCFRILWALFLNHYCFSCHFDCDYCYHRYHCYSCLLSLDNPCHDYRHDVCWLVVTWLS